MFCIRSSKEKWFGWFRLAVTPFSAAAVLAKIHRKYLQLSHRHTENDGWDKWRVIGKLDDITICVTHNIYRAGFFPPWMFDGFWWVGFIFILGAILILLRFCVDKCKTTVLWWCYGVLLQCILDGVLLQCLDSIGKLIYENALELFVFQILRLGYSFFCVFIRNCVYSNHCYRLISLICQ